MGIRAFTKEENYEIRAVFSNKMAEVKLYHGCGGETVLFFSLSEIVYL